VENLTSENFGKCTAALVDCVSFAVFDPAVLESAVVAGEESLPFEPHAAREAARRAVVTHLTKEVVSLIGYFFVIICIVGVEIRRGRPVTATFPIRSTIHYVFAFI
jgi:hypothetical protein